ncbi:MAG: hypothetical protein ACNA77_06975 [Opitutales bacterium]
MQIPTSSEKVNVICLKFGNLYGPHYVNRLYAGVKRHLNLPFRFICVTEKPEGLDPAVEAIPFPLPKGMPERYRMGFWTKLAVTADDFHDLHGPTLFLDIDQVIVGSLDDFFDYKPGRNCIIHNWLPWRKTLLRQAPQIGNSSVFRFEAGKSQYIFERFVEEHKRAMDRSQFRTEQAFLTYAMGENREWWPATWVKSFKRHCIPTCPLNLIIAPKLPRESKIICFHGKPNPDELVGGYWQGQSYYRCKEPTWFRKNWVDLE